jgi:hypothetical protein
MCSYAPDIFVWIYLVHLELLPFPLILLVSGYARLSNVEFYHTGQEGYTDEYDPRFSVAFVAVGTVSDIRPSIVTKCSFHNGFNTAIGAFGTSSLNIMDNVVFGSIGNGMTLDSIVKYVKVKKINVIFVSIVMSSPGNRIIIFKKEWFVTYQTFVGNNIYMSIYL